MFFKCKTVITAYGPVILQLVANEIEPDQICRIIGMCPMNEIKAKVDDNPQCVLCEFVMKTLSSYVNVNSTTVSLISDFVKFFLTQKFFILKG